MDLIEKRHDAANTLVVPYDATPDMVNSAYERRVMQRFYLDNADVSYMNGMMRLYDARVRMNFSQKNQWLAEFRLRTTRQASKTMNILQTVISGLQRDATDIAERQVLLEIQKELSSINIKTNITHGIWAYSLTGLGAMMVYDTVRPNHAPIIPLIVYTSIIIGIIAAGCAMDSVRHNHERVQMLLAVWNAIKKAQAMEQLLQQQK